MILTLAWKELREHAPIWTTMVVATALLGVGLARVIAPGDAALALAVAALTIFGMAATYGVVCGAMMFAGEHEGGTLVFLDIFLGRRGRLWFGKLLAGVVLVATEALAVALALYLLQQPPPQWAAAAVGFGDPAQLGRPQRFGAPLGPDIWFWVLPAVTLEAFAWGLFGSSLTRRVLAGAAIAAAAASPVWLTVICLPPPVFFGLRLLAAAGVAIASGVIFMTQSRETALGPALTPEEAPDPRRRFLELADMLDRADEQAEVQPVAVLAEPAVIDLQAAHAPPTRGGRSAQAAARPAAAAPRRRDVPQADSPREVLAWLTFQQAWLLLAILAGVCLLLGLFVPSRGEVLWPAATLLLGVACGTAAFAPEQRDLSYQFLATQHFPLPAIWRFKVAVWLTAAVALALLLAASAALMLAARNVGQREPAGMRFGALHAILGPVLFFGVWLAYGFCTAQVFVWLCRKSILAILVSALVSAGALGLWMPSLLCQGMGGWQAWAPPLAFLAAGQWLVRAWAGGRIKERRPLYALIGVGVACLGWAGLNFLYRATEIPNVGAPLDRAAFRAAIPTGPDNAAGRKIQEAIGAIDHVMRDDRPLLTALADLPRLPAGVIEPPAGNGQNSPLLYLSACERIVDYLRTRAGPAEPSLARLTEILALSRSLRNKAPLEAYLAGTRAEARALDNLAAWLADARPNAALLRRALDELSRHTAETPPALDCLRTECFSAGGLAEDPAAWSFTVAGPRAPGMVPERWLVGSIVLSLEAPWEAERKTRLWQAVWAGLFRAVNAPAAAVPEWQLDPGTSATTRRILRGWLPADTGPDAGLTPAQLARLLDASWLAQDRLFCRVATLRAADARSRWRVAAYRQVLALKLYEAEQGKAAQKLEDLVPRYLPALPADPYRDAAFGYRISPGEQIEGLGAVRAGQGMLWCTGPDRTDNGGQAHGGAVPDDDPRWQRGGLDLVTLVP